MSKKVFLGVGHGGKDGGAVYGGLLEKDINLQMALACRDELERHEVQVLLSRTKDEDDVLSDEIKECNKFMPDFAIDIHNNAGGGRGFEAYYQSKNGVSLRLARSIEHTIGELGQNSRGCKVKLNTHGTDWFGFVRECKCPAILIESAFIDSSDRFLIDEISEQKSFGVAIAKGILSELDIIYKPIIPEIPETYYYIWVGKFTSKERATEVAHQITFDLKCYNEVRKI